MVTASDGSPKTVTKTPLTAPSTAPSSTLATDRSISPVITTSVIGRAINAIGIASSVTNRQNLGLATPSMVAPPITITATSARITIASHDPSTDRSRTVPARCCSGATCLPSSQTAGDAHREGAVQPDRHQDQRADSGPLPERVDAEHRQRGADGGEQDGAQRRAVHRTAPPEDRHTADHDRRHHVELEAEARVSVQRAEPGDVEHPGKPGECAVGHERGEHPPADRDTGQPRGVRV